MIKNQLHTISDQDAIEVSRILLKSHLPYKYDFVKINRVSYNEQHGVDSEETVNVYFNANVTHDSYKKAGWKDKFIMVQLIESDRYHDHPYFHANSRKFEGDKNTFTDHEFLANQIEAVEFLQGKKLI